MVKWIIFYIGLHGVNEPPMGDILFFEGDSVKAFDVMWVLTGKEKVITKQAVIFSGVFQLEHKGVKASITVISKEITFMMGDVIISFRQRNHEDFLYEYVEDFYPIKNKYNSSSLVDVPPPEKKENQ